LLRGARMLIYPTELKSGPWSAKDELHLIRVAEQHVYFVSLPHPFPVPASRRCCV
jgi:hypothetical protein